MATVTGRSHSADLVIIGAGGAGLTAAAAALEQGLTDIVMLEKAASPGGNTAQSAGMFAVGSPAQKRRGIEVPPQVAFREKMEYAHWRIDPELTRACIERSGGMVEWLENKGMHFESVVEFLREGQAPKVFHSFSPGPPGFIGRTVVDTLAEECVRRGARFLHKTAATGLLRAVESRGEVAGVIAHSGDEEVLIDAEAVILAAGGFGANRELLERFFPGHGDVFTKSYPEMTGDGLMMAEATGATIDENMLLLLTGPHHYPWSHVLTLLVRRPELLLVNKRGERYCDETIFLDFHSEAGNALSRQPDKICYGLLDAGLKDRMIGRRDIVSGMEREAGGAGAWLEELDQELEAGVKGETVLKGATWEELARPMGVGPEKLRETVARYNACCDRGSDEDFFKERAFLLPLRTPPYYAVLGRQGFDTTLGGIKVDHHLRVIDQQGLPIPGLYAVGDCASQWEYANYNLRHPGSAMTFALCSGFIAGQEAADYVRQSHS
jgi:fumarate reductase flavoprotein subunit